MNLYKWINKKSEESVHRDVRCDEDPPVLAGQLDGQACQLKQSPTPDLMSAAPRCPPLPVRQSHTPRSPHPNVCGVGSLLRLPAQAPQPRAAHSQEAPGYLCQASAPRQVGPLPLSRKHHRRFRTNVSKLKQQNG